MVKNFSKDAIDSISTGLIERAEKDCADRGIVTITALKSALQERDTESMVKFTDLLQRKGFLLVHRPRPWPPSWTRATSCCALTRCSRTTWIAGTPTHRRACGRFPKISSCQMVQKHHRIPRFSCGLAEIQAPAFSLPQIGEGQPRCLRCAIAESRRQQEADLPAVPYRIEHTTSVLSDWRCVMQPVEESVLSRPSDSPTGEELSYALRRSLKILCESYVAFVFKRSRHS